MSSPLAIAAVTATIKDLLNDGLLNHDLSSIGSFTVTSLPPDRISTGQTEPNQLNVFLYQVTPNSGWRNNALPSRDPAGARMSNPPLALDLHYLITAYGSEDLNAEVLLGYAMSLLHETPVLTRQQLRTVLGGVSPVDGSILPSPFGTLSAEDLADQIELVKITPVFLNTEDLSKLWTSMQARYRPSMAYMASVVLIQANAATKSAPPVLRRGPEDRGPVALAAPFPSLAAARPAASDLLPAVRLGERVRLTGANLSQQGTTTIVLEHAATGQQRERAPVTVTGNAIEFDLPSVAAEPDAMHQWQPGLYTVSLRVSRPNQPDLRSNGVPLALAPRITVSPLAAGAGDFTVTVQVTPRLDVRQETRTSVVFGSDARTPTSISTPADPLQPTVVTLALEGVGAGEYLVRLRVEGIESVPVLISGTPARLSFDPAQKVVVQ